MSLHWSSVVVLVISLQSTSGGDDWLAFRGTAGNGINHEIEFPTEWSSEKNVKWRTPLPGPGNGSPIVVDGKVILLCAENQGQQRSTLCFSRESGDQLWKKTVDFDSIEMTHKTNPYCPSTPTSDGTHVFVWHRSAGMHCYDLEGNEIWSRDLGRFDHIWGGGSSPVLYHELVIQLCGPGERTFLTALDKNTGETVWETPLEEGGSSSEKSRYVGTWATPVITRDDGRDLIVCPYHVRTVMYDPRTGDEISYVEGLQREKSDLCYASPTIANDIVLIQGGFQGPAFGFRLGGTGNTTTKNRLWRTSETRNPQRIGSGVVIDGFLYLANADNSGSIECLDVRNGEQMWVERRSSDGPHWASLVFAGGQLYATGQQQMTVFHPNPERFEQISINSLGEHCNATPAFSDGEIFVRTWNALYCLSGN